MLLNIIKNNQSIDTVMSHAKCYTQDRRVLIYY